MSNTVYLSPDGLQQLKDDLHFLKTKERARIANAIAEARAQGDLSENAEYDAAKEEQGHLEARIAKLEGTLGNARVVDEKSVDASKAYILSHVQIKNKKTGAKMKYQLVAQAEADIRSGKISVDSPIGKALLGTSVGDEVEVKVPAGKVMFEVIDISR